jgi:hypothetical protein
MNERYALTALISGVFLFMILRNKKPRGIRNNNPLNIRKSGDDWQGAVGDDGEFIQFALASKGIRAAARILKNYRDKYGLNTVSGIINRWAPPNENDTESYINSVSAKINVDSEKPLDDSEYPALIAAMINHENGLQPYAQEIIYQGFREGFYS